MVAKGLGGGKLVGLRHPSNLRVGSNLLRRCWHTTTCALFDALLTACCFVAKFGALLLLWR